MPVLLVVPARVGSTRLPNKPLQLLGGVPLVSRVAARALMVPGVDRVVVATDSDEIARAVADLPVDVLMTSSALASGTDRVAAVAVDPRYSDCDIVVNLQGDEPFMPVEAVSGAISRVRDEGDPIGTAAAPMLPADLDDPSKVKVVMTWDGRALYFSRAAIPYLRDGGVAPPSGWWQHLGVYAYRRDVLLAFTAMPPSGLEEAERLEQLRALEAGYDIGVARLDSPAPAGIDTPEDLAAAEVRWQQSIEAES